MTYLTSITKSISFINRFVTYARDIENAKFVGIWHVSVEGINSTSTWTFYNNGTWCDGGGLYYYTYKADYGVLIIDDGDFEWNYFFTDDYHLIILIDQTVYSLTKIV